jgi:hypothetical protein
MKKQKKEEKVCIYSVKYDDDDDVSSDNCFIKPHACPV